jgi:hypothetical protein
MWKRGNLDVSSDRLSFPSGKRVKGVVGPEREKNGENPNGRQKEEIKRVRWKAEGMVFLYVCVRERVG